MCATAKFSGTPSLSCGGRGDGAITGKQRECVVGREEKRWKTGGRRWKIGENREVSLGKG